MTDNFTADAPSVVKPYDFGKATFVPFQDFKFSSKLILSYMVIGLLIGAVAIFFLWRDYLTLMQVSASPETVTDPTIVFSALGTIIVKGFIFLILGWMLYASYITAFHRRFTLNQNLAGFPLSFGRTELQLMLVQLVMFFIMIAFVIGFYIAVLIPVFIAIAIGQAGSAGTVIGAIIGFVGVIAAIIGFLYLSARFVAVGGLTVANNRFTIGETFAATKGRGWWIVLSFIVAFLIVMVISLIVQMIFSIGIFASLPFDQLAGMEDASDEEVMAILSSTLKSPTFWLVVVITYLVTTFVQQFANLMFPGIGSYVTREFKGGHDLEAISSLYD